MQFLSLWVKSKHIEEIRGDDLKMKIHKAVVFAPVIGVQALRLIITHISINVTLVRLPKHQQSLR